VGTTKSDAMVERGAQRLHALSEAAARRGGLAGKLAQPLAEDAAFLRKLKPSLIKARMKGEAPTSEKPQPVAGPTPARRDTSGADGGPNPAAVIAGAAAAGLALAKVIDWRGHAHPRR
jgi:hypothetical protein